nr:hypothetical protein CFP56_44027 [Quercus suber]
MDRGEMVGKADSGMDGQANDRLDGSGMDAEIASGKYILSTGGMTHSRALRLITQFVVLQGFIDVALKTYVIGYTLDYNDPAGAAIDEIKAQELTVARPMIR